MERKFEFEDDDRFNSSAGTAAARASATKTLEKAPRFSQLDEDEAARLYEERYRQIESDMKKIHAKRGNSKKHSMVTRSNSSLNVCSGNTPTNPHGMSSTLNSWKSTNTHAIRGNSTTSSHFNSQQQQQQQHTPFGNSSKFCPSSYQAQSTSLSGASRVSTEENFPPEIPMNQLTKSAICRDNNNSNTPFTSSASASQNNWKHSKAVLAMSATLPGNFNINLNSTNHQQQQQQQLQPSQGDIKQFLSPQNNQKPVKSYNTRVETSPTTDRVQYSASSAGFYSPQSKRHATATTTQSQVANGNQQQQKSINPSSKSMKKSESNLSLNNPNKGSSHTNHTSATPSNKINNNNNSNKFNLNPQSTKNVNFGFQQQNQHPSTLQQSASQSSYLFQGNSQQSNNQLMLLMQNNLSTKSNKIASLVGNSAVSPGVFIDFRKPQFSQSLQFEKKKKTQKNFETDHHQTTPPTVSESSEAVETVGVTTTSTTIPTQQQQQVGNKKQKMKLTSSSHPTRTRLDYLPSQTEITAFSCDNSHLNTPRSVEMQEYRQFTNLQQQPGESGNNTQQSQSHQKQRAGQGHMLQLPLQSSQQDGRPRVVPPSPSQAFAQIRTSMSDYSKDIDSPRSVKSNSLSNSNSHYLSYQQKPVSKPSSFKCIPLPAQSSLSQSTSTSNYYPTTNKRNGSASSSTHPEHHNQLTRKQQYQATHHNHQVRNTFESGSSLSGSASCAAAAGSMSSSDEKEIETQEFEYIESLVNHNNNNPATLANNLEQNASDDSCSISSVSNKNQEQLFQQQQQQQQQQQHRKAILVSSKPTPTKILLNNKELTSSSLDSSLLPHDAQSISSETSSRATPQSLSTSQKHIQLTLSQQLPQNNNSSYTSYTNSNNNSRQSLRKSDIMHNKPSHPGLSLFSQTAQTTSSSSLRTHATGATSTPNQLTTSIKLGDAPSKKQSHLFSNNINNSNNRSQPNVQLTSSGNFGKGKQTNNSKTFSRQSSSSSNSATNIRDSLRGNVATTTTPALQNQHLQQQQQLQQQLQLQLTNSQKRQLQSSQNGNNHFTSEQHSYQQLQHIQQKFIEARDRAKQEEEELLEISKNIHQKLNQLRENALQSNHSNNQNPKSVKPNEPSSNPVNNGNINA